MNSFRGMGLGSGIILAIIGIILFAFPTLSTMVFAMLVGFGILVARYRHGCRRLGYGHTEHHLRLALPAVSPRLRRGRHLVRRYCGHCLWHRSDHQPHHDP